MTNNGFSLNRRGFVGSVLGGGAARMLVGPVDPAGAQQLATLNLKVVPRSVRLSDDLPPSLIWALVSDSREATKLRLWFQMKLQ